MKEMKEKKKTSSDIEFPKLEDVTNVVLGERAMAFARRLARKWHNDEVNNILENTRNANDTATFIMPHLDEKQRFKYEVDPSSRMDILREKCPWFKPWECLNEKERKERLDEAITAVKVYTKKCGGTEAAEKEFKNLSNGVPDGFEILIRSTERGPLKWMAHTFEKALKEFNEDIINQGDKQALSDDYLKWDETWRDYMRRQCGIGPSKWDPHNDRQYEGTNKETLGILCIMTPGLKIPKKYWDEAVSAVLGREVHYRDLLGQDGKIPYKELEKELKERLTKDPKESLFVKDYDWCRNEYPERNIIDLENNEFIIDGKIPCKITAIPHSQVFLAKKSGENEDMLLVSSQGKILLSRITGVSKQVDNISVIRRKPYSRTDDLNEFIFCDMNSGELKGPGRIMGIGNFKDGLAVIKNFDGEFNYVDHSGNILLNHWVDKATEFESNLAKVKLHDTVFEINTKGIITRNLTKESKVNDITTAPSLKM